MGESRRVSLHPNDPNQEFPALPDTQQLNSPAAAAGGRARSESRRIRRWLTHCVLRRGTGRAVVLVHATAGAGRGLPGTGHCDRRPPLELHCPVLLEGYEPPSDPRLSNFRITPDPGVIEVNAYSRPRLGMSWSGAPEFLYEEARQTRLTPPAFAIDGRHTGTGGGNHFVLGGATPADSPFLRRRICCAKSSGYWHNHPSLSYLFSSCSSARRPRRRASAKPATMR